MISSFKPTYLHHVTNLDELNRIEESLSWAIRCQVKPRWSLEIILFKFPNWVAVPVVFFPTDENSIFSGFWEKVQSVLKLQGYTEVYGVILDSVSSKYYSETYIIPVTSDGFYEFVFNFGYSFCCAIFAGMPEPDFVLISIESEFYVVAGSVDFIRKFLGCEVEEAFKRFQDLASNTKYLKALYDRFKDKYQEAEIGEEFLI